MKTYKLFDIFNVLFYNQNMNIGEIIIQLRKENNLRQTELGKGIGVSARAISYWEKGINEPKATYILRNYQNFSAYLAIIC